MYVKKRVKVNCCLDEIEAAQIILEKDKGDKKVLNGWIRNHKSKLKELKYKGKIRRKKKS